MKVPETVEREWKWEFRPATKGQGEHVTVVSPNSFVHSRFDGEWYRADKVTRLALPDPVRIAAERMFWREKTLGEASRARTAEEERVVWEGESGGCTAFLSDSVSLLVLKGILATETSGKRIRITILGEGESNG